MPSTKLGNFDLPRDYRTTIIHGQEVEVRVYATSQKNRRRSRMTKSGRKFKRNSMSMAEMRSNGFCK